MYNIDYDYLLKNLNDIYNTKLTKDEFKRWLDKDLKNPLYKRKFINKLLSEKEKKVYMKMSEVCTVDQIARFKIKSYYNIKKNINLFSISGLIKNLRILDNFMELLDKKIIEININDCKRDLYKLKKVISNQKYNNYFNRELIQINKILKLLNHKKIVDEFYNIEDDLSKITKKLFNQISIKINDYNKNQNNFEEKKTEIIENNNNLVILKDDQKIISIEKYKNKINYKVKDYGKINKEKQSKANILNMNYNYLISNDLKIDYMKFFECKQEQILSDLRLSNEEVINLCDYIKKLKNEFMYLVKYNEYDEKKLVELITNADRLINKNKMIILEKKKVKKIA